MAFTKITEEELNSRGCTTLPNQPTISPTELKEEFDAPAKEIVAPKFNNLIDELEADTAAASLGINAPSGRVGNTIQNLINNICNEIDSIETRIPEDSDDILDAIAKKHTHANKALLDTYTQTETNLADAVDKKHSHSNKTVLDKFNESSGKPTYNGTEIGGTVLINNTTPLTNIVISTTDIGEGATLDAGTIYIVVE